MSAVALWIDVWLGGESWLRRGAGRRWQGVRKEAQVARAGTPRWGRQAGAMSRDADPRRPHRGMEQLMEDKT